MSFGGSGSYPNYGSTGARPSPVRASNTTRYNQLCDNISCNIFAINNGASALDRALKELGTQSDTDILRNQIHTTQQTTNDLINATTSFLKELSSIAQRGGKEQRLQSDKLRNEFQDSVQRYSSLQKQVVSKMKYTMVAKPSKPTSGYSNWGMPDDDLDGHYGEETKNLEQQRLLQEELDFEHNLLIEREQRIRQIEADMLDVNQIFCDLAAVVHEQGAAVETIESNVIKACDNVDEGHNQLVRASKYQRGFRKKACCLIVILLTVVAVVTIIIVVLQR